MTSTTHPHGFRIIGPCTGDRRRVDAARAFQAYCACDARAGVDREAYLSAFQFDDGFAEHLARTGSPADFAGSTWAPFVWLDVDRDAAAGGIARALADTRQLVDVLDERFGVPRGVLVPFVSGGKGLHFGCRRRRSTFTGLPGSSPRRLPARPASPSTRACSTRCGRSGHRIAGTLRRDCTSGTSRSTCSNS